MSKVLSSIPEADNKLYRVEKRSRTLLKAISWRLLGSLTTFGVTFSLTSNFNIATIVGIAELVTKIVLFYVHERIWIKINAHF